MWVAGDPYWEMHWDMLYCELLGHSPTQLESTSGKPLTLCHKCGKTLEDGRCETTN